MKKEIKTNSAPSPTGAYSQAVVTKNGVLYVSSQMPIDPVTGKLPETIEGQTNQLIDNIKNILLEADHDLDNVVKVTVYLSDKNNFKEFNEIYKSRFSKPYPARAVILNDLDNELIEMDVISEKN